MFGTRKRIGRFALVGFFFSIIFSVPQAAFAQAFVPVRDQPLTNAFNAFATNFTNTFGGQPSGSGASIRDIISGGNIRARDANGNLTPFGQVYGDCVQGDAELLAEAYSASSPWGRAHVYDADVLDEYPAPNTYVQVNKSESLRCLLMEIVQFQKLSASTQIHQVLLEYLTKAQTKERSNKLSSEITAAEVTYLKEGYTSPNNGVAEALPLNVTSPEEYRNKEGEKEASYLSKQVMNSANDPVAGLGYCDAFKEDAAQQAIAAGERMNTDSYDRYEDSVSCGQDDPNNGIFTSQAAYSEFLSNPNDPDAPQGATLTLSDMFNDPTTYKIGAMHITNEIAERRIQEAQDEFDAVSSGENSVLPVPSNIDDPANPDGVRKYRTYVTPQTNVSDTLNDATKEGKRQVRDVEYTGSEPNDPARDLAESGSSPGGFSGINTTRLATAPAQTNAMIKELYNIIYTGYFDISLNTTDWARATMLMIYDEMNFDDSKLADEVPQTGANAQGADTQTNDPNFEDWR